MLAVIIVILFLHWFADFVCQTRWMAENKSKNSLALSLHILTYSLVMFVGMSSLLPLVTIPSFLGVLLFTLVNAACHFFTDYITSRMNAHFWQNEQKAFFWWNIGFDQFIHQVTLLILMRCFLPV